MGKAEAKAQTITAAQYWQLRWMMVEQEKIEHQLKTLIAKRAQLYADTGLELNANYMLNDETCTVTPQ